MKNKTHSVNGLANIAALLNRTDPPTTSPATRERRNTADIASLTTEKILAALPLGANLDPKHKKLIDTFVCAGVKAAHSLGHAEALEQNSAVEKLLEKQYDARTKVTMPAVAAAIMGQLNMPSMVLDLALMATVFQRCEIAYTISDEDVIEYTLRPVGENGE